MTGDFNQRWDDELDRREERRFLRELINDDPDFWRGIGLKRPRKPSTSASAAAEARPQNINSDKEVA